MSDTESTISSGTTASPSGREIMLYGAHRITVLMPVGEGDEVFAQWVRLSSVGWTPCDAFVDSVTEVFKSYQAVVNATRPGAEANNNGARLLTEREGLGLVADAQGALRYWCDPASGIVHHLGFDSAVPVDVWHMRTFSLEKDEISIGERFSTQATDLWAAGQPIF